MPRPIWSGAISFGLVNIPIKLYSAVKKKSISFHQLRRNDGCRIRLKKVCSTDGEEVEKENIVKGYEVSPDRYVIVSSDELQSLSPKASRNIEIEDFVELSQIDPLYFEQSFYLVPDKGAAKAYTLLLTAMRTSGKTAIARFVLRNKEYLSAIRPINNALSLSTMHFTDEIIAVAELESLPEDTAEPAKRELAMAEQLIQSLTADFEPEKYRNEYQEKVMNLIESKAEGQEIVAKPEVNEGGRVIDLMAALEASLSAAKKKPTAAKSGRKKARAQ
ncbi:MAG: ykoV [Firmicutes bacterium]|nr:ykoV [Bacillota bacterium]